MIRVLEKLLYKERMKELGLFNWERRHLGGGRVGKWHLSVCLST